MQSLLRNTNIIPPICAQVYATFFFLLFILSGCVEHDIIHTQDSIMAFRKLYNSSDALAASVRLTGLSGSPPNITISSVVVSDDQTPVLWRDFNGAKAWSIELRKVVIKLNSGVDQPDMFAGLRTFRVLINEETGQLLGIRSHFEGSTEDMRPEPSRSFAEAQLAGREKYLGLPPVLPKLTFMEAVDAVLDHGVGDPLLAKEIDGFYVMFSGMGFTSRPVWVITLRG